MAIVNGYDAYVINPNILSEYNVDQSGEVVSAEVWKALWDLVLGVLIKYDRAFIDIYRTLTDLNTELDNCIQRVDRIEEIYDALAERMETLEKTWTELQATYNKIAGHYEDIKDIHDALKEGLVHYGVDAPTLKYTKLWVVPTQFPLSPLHDIVNAIITSRTDSELDENSENPVQNKVIVKHLAEVLTVIGEELDTLRTEIMGDLDEIGDLVGGKNSGTGELIADIGNVELVYNEDILGYVGTFTLPENSIEPNKLYIINIGGTEYISGSAGADAQILLSSDVREDLMIVLAKQEGGCTVAIRSQNDFSGVHNIKIYANSSEKKSYQILVGSKTDTGTGDSGMVYFYTDDFDAGSYNLEIKDEESTFNFDRYRYLDNTAFGFKSCDKSYSDASLKQVYLAIAEGKKVSFIVTGEIDGIETTKTYILGTPDFEFTNQETPRHYYGYGENFIPHADYPS